MDDDTRQMVEVIRRMELLSALYADPHPGLITWQLARRDTERELAEMLISIDPQRGINE